MKKFVHIGYPKNFSTSLQRSFFPLHEEIFHLGIGPGIGYIDPLVDATFEVYLKSAKTFKYREAEARIKIRIDELIRESEVREKKAITVSGEHLSFAFTNDTIDFEEKMRRLAMLFGQDTQIILIIREQSELIKSLYRESVRTGFPGNYRYYLYLLYKYQDRNFCYDMRYDLVYETLSQHFNVDGIHFLMFEEMKTRTGLVIQKGRVRLLETLCNILGVSYLETDFWHFNEALPDAVIKAKSVLNAAHRHSLGNILYETAEKHRMKEYLRHEMQLFETEDQLYEDVRMKRALIAAAAVVAENNNGEKLHYAADPEIAMRLKNFYEAGNHRLETLTRLKLPESYFQLNF